MGNLFDQRGGSVCVCKEMTVTVNPQDTHQQREQIIVIQVQQSTGN